MVKKYKAEIIFFYICSAISLIFASFWDLKIDIALNNPENPFAIWFYNTGEMPSRLICPLAGVVIFYLARNKIEKTAGFIVCMGGSAYLGYHIGDYFFKEENNIVFGIIYGIGTGLIILLVGKYIKLPEEYKAPLRTVAYAGIITMFAQLAITEFSKYLWGRLRFREMLAQGSYEGFTPWYHPNGFNFSEGNKVKSFPSGHTAGAGMGFTAMMLPYVSKKFSDKKTICFAVPFIYTVVVAYTRLVMGAHFLSDVTVGAMISFSVIICAMSIMDKKSKTPLEK